MGGGNMSARFEIPRKIFTCADQRVELRGIIPENGTPQVEVRQLRRSASSVEPDDFSQVGPAVPVPLPLVLAVSEEMATAHHLLAHALKARRTAEAGEGQEGKGQHGASS
jgi:hypothetical protein